MNLIFPNDDWVVGNHCRPVIACECRCNQKIANVIQFRWCVSCNRSDTVKCRNFETWWIEIPNVNCHSHWTEFFFRKWLLKEHCHRITVCSLYAWQHITGIMAQKVEEHHWLHKFKRKWLPSLRNHDDSLSETEVFDLNWIWFSTFLVFSYYVTLLGAWVLATAMQFGDTWPERYESIHRYLHFDGL